MTQSLSPTRTPPEATPPRQGISEPPFLAADEETVHHTPYRKRHPVLPKPVTVNMTPMIDVVFQLLIYFMLTLNFVIGEGVLTAKLPTGPGQPNPQSKPPERPLNITLRSSGAVGCIIGIEGMATQSANFRELSQKLAELQYNPELGRQGAYKPDNPVVIKPDSTTRWQHVVNAFNAAIKARYLNVSFAQASEPGSETPGDQ